MSIMFSKPIKFECQKCNKIYLQPYQHTAPVLHCPHCKEKGLLLGFAEAQDWFRYPIDGTLNYIKRTWHMLSSTR